MAQRSRRDAAAGQPPLPTAAAVPALAVGHQPPVRPDAIESDCTTWPLILLGMVILFLLVVIAMMLIFYQRKLRAKRHAATKGNVTTHELQLGRTSETRMEFGHIDKVGIVVTQGGMDIPLYDKYHANGTPTASPSGDLRLKATNFDEESYGSAFSDDPSSQDVNVDQSHLFKGAEEWNNLQTRKTKLKACAQKSNISVSSTLSFAVNDCPQFEADTSTKSKSSNGNYYSAVSEGEEPKPDLEDNRPDPWLHTSIYEDVDSVATMKGEGSSKLGKSSTARSTIGTASNVAEAQPEDDLGEWIVDDEPGNVSDVIMIMKGADGTKVAVHKTGQISLATEYPIVENENGDAIFITDSGIPVSTALAFGAELSSASKQTVIYSDNDAYFLVDPDTGDVLAHIMDSQVGGSVPASAKTAIVTTKEGKLAFRIAGATVAPLSVFDIPDGMEEGQYGIISAGDGTFVLCDTASTEVVSRVSYKDQPKPGLAIKSRKDHFTAKTVRTDEVSSVMENTDGTLMAVYNTGKTSPVTEYAIGKNNEGVPRFVTDTGIPVSIALAFGPQISSSLEQTVVYSDGDTYFLTDPDTRAVVARLEGNQVHKASLVKTKEGTNAFRIAGTTEVPVELFDIPADMEEGQYGVISTGDNVYTMFDTTSTDIISRVVYSGLPELRSATKHQTTCQTATRGTAMGITNNGCDDVYEMCELEEVADLTSFAKVRVVPRCERKPVRLPQDGNYDYMTLGEVSKKVSKANVMPVKMP